MKTFLLSLVLTLAVAASLIIVIDRFLMAGRSRHSDEQLVAVEARLASLEALLSAKSLAATPSGLPTGDRRERAAPGSKSINDVVRSIEDLEGLVLDSERRLRQDLVGVFEKLTGRLEEISASGNVHADSASAKQQLYMKLEELGVKLSPEERMLEIEGELSETSRAIEYLAVAPGGRAYESLLIVDVTPSALKIGLEEIGLRESEPNLDDGTWSEDASGAYIYVLWEGSKKPSRVEDLILNRQTNDCMTRTKWMFTASRFFTDMRTWERHFSADFNKSVVAISLGYGLDAVLACPLPEAADENLFVPHPRFAPNPGTKVRVFFRAEPHEVWDKI